MANIIDKKINPEIPIVQESNRNEVYLPRASYTNTGTAGFYKTHFIVDDNGIVHLRKAPERAVSAITYDSNTNTLIITFDDETVETIKLNDCGCVDGTDILVYDAFKVINFKETSWYDTSTNKVLIISAAETGYDNDELVCQLDKYNVINTNVNDNVVTSNYQSNYEYQIYKCTDGSIAIFANTAFAGRFIILKREFAVQKNVANITYDDTTGILTVYYVTGDKQNILLDRAIIELDFPNGEFTSVQYDTDDGITLEGTAKAKYKDGTETDMNVTFDIPLVPADDTVTIDRAEEAETKKVLVKATKGLSAIQSTDDGGLEFTLSDGTKLYTAPIGGVGVDIGASLPASAVQGTLTAAQLQILQASEDNYIMFQHEKYYLNGKGHREGYITYTHTGYENSTYWIKSITITLSTRAWVLNKGALDEDGLENVNAYTSTSEPQLELPLNANATMYDLLVAITNSKAKAVRGTLNPNIVRGQVLANLLGVPKDVEKASTTQIFFRVLSAEIDVKAAVKKEVIIQAVLHDKVSHQLFHGYIHNWGDATAYWTGWVPVTTSTPNPAPLYVGEQYEGADAYYSVISFDAHRADLIFRANYIGKDIKLSELALKSEVGGTYYRHVIRLYNTATFTEANNVVYFELISTSMVAIDSLTDLYTYCQGPHAATGCIGSVSSEYGPVTSVVISTSGGSVYYVDANSNFSRQVHDTLAVFGLTYVSDTVKNI